MARSHFPLSRGWAALAAALVLGLPACGSNSPGKPNPLPTTMPSAARVEVSQPSTAQLCFSPLSNFFFRLRLPVRFTESGGLGANVNFVRFSLWLGSTEVERREATADDLRAMGAQRVNANATVNATLGFDFNADPDSFDTVRIDFNITDDRGNNTTARWDDVTNLVLSLPFCTI